MKILILLTLCFALLVPAPGRAALLIQPNDRLAICGDSATANLGYSAYVEDYLLACQPIEGIHVSEFGWSAETAKDFEARLETDVAPFHPTVVMTCFGMNDGGYKALDADTAAAYQKAQTDMVEAFKKDGVRTIIVGSPRCVDPLTFNKDPAQGVAYNKTLHALADIDKAVAAKEGVVYADVFGATVTAMMTAKAHYGPKYVFDIGDQWNLVMASAFLKALGCDGNIGTITADFRAKTATVSAGHKILSFADQTLSVESDRYPLCFIHLYNSGVKPEPWIKGLLFPDSINRLLLVAKNLPSPRAKVIWHDQLNDSQDFTAAQLAQGINFATEFNDSPFGGHFENVNGGVVDQQQEERIIGSAFVRTGVRDAAADARRDAAFQKALAAVVPVTYNIRIQPLAADETQPPGPVNIIDDSDMSGDCDDAGAVALLNAFMNQGECRILACVVDGRDRDLSSGAAVQAINAYYGHPNIPIGANHGEAWIGATGSAYTLKIHQQFDPDFPTDDKLPAGVDVYRRALASAPNGSVVICSHGLMENLLALLNSKPDAISPLSGRELIRRKVRKLVIMGNTDKHDGSVIDTWPTKILYTTYVGSVIYTGQTLVNTPENNPVRVIYRLNGAENGRPSWDLTAAWLAVRGPGALWDVTYGGYRKVDPVTGESPWIDGPPTKEAYVMERMPSQEVAKLIDAELSRPPKP